MNSASIGEPVLIQVRPDLVLFSFDCIKVYPAAFIVDRETRGRKSENVHFVTSSSGTFARALAHVCFEGGHGCTIVTEPAIQPTLVSYLQALDADVHVVNLVGDNAQLERMQATERIVENLRNQKPGSRIVQIDQYSDDGIVRGYQELGKRIAERLEKYAGPVTLYGPVGSGGSTIGVTNGLKTLRDDVNLVGVDHLNSVLFGQRFSTEPKSLSRVVRGIGNSVQIGILDQQKYKRVYKLSDAWLIAGALALMEKSRAFLGPTTGGSYAAALLDETLKVQSNGLKVMISPDSGWRYSETIYSRNWRDAHGFGDATLDSLLELVDADVLRTGFMLSAP